MRVRRAGVYVLAPNVGIDDRPVRGIRGNEPLHLGERGGDGVRVRVREGEAHATDEHSHETLVGIGSERGRDGVSAALEQKRGDRTHRYSIKALGDEAKSTPHDVNHAYHHRGLPRPLVAPRRVVDLAAVFTDPAKAA